MKMKHGFKRLIVCLVTMISFAIPTVLADVKDINNFRPEKNSYILPQIDVYIVLSEKAQKHLAALGEHIKVVFHLYYNPSDMVEPPKYNNKDEKTFYEFFSRKELIVPPINGFAYLPEWKIPKINTKKFAPFLVINIVSARDVEKFNLLNCSIYCGDYPENSKDRIKVTCKLIRGE